MSLRLLTTRCHLLSVGVIVVFIISLGIAISRLLEIERDLRDDVAEDLVWLVSQAQFEVLRFADAVGRPAAGRDASGADELGRRFDVLLSRLQVLREGQPRQLLSEIEVIEHLDRSAIAIAALEPQLAATVAGDAGAARLLRSTALPLAMRLRDIANQSMLFQRDRALALRDRRQQILVEILGCVIGILASGVILSVQLVRQLHEAARAEAELQRQRDANELYRGFVSMVSHQFRTPLAIVDSSAQRMLRRGTAMGVDELAARVGKIRGAVLRLTTLVESTLNAARLDAGAVTVEPRPCDLAALIREIGQRQGEITPGRTIRLELAGLPPRVRCDPVLLEQVIANLLANAIKYSPDTTPVEVRAWSARGEILISIRDYGVGIPADELPRLFERFFRARTASGIAGTGLGLSIARHIARLHGGDITVASEEGAGAAFTVRLPLPTRVETAGGTHTEEPERV